MKRVMAAILVAIIGTIVFIFSCGDWKSTNNIIDKIIKED